MKIGKLLSLTLAGLMTFGITAYAEETTEWEYKEADLTLLADGSSTLDGLKAVAELAKEKLGINIVIETQPGGEEGNNIIRACFP